MLVWDPVSERNLPFGTLKTAALGKCIQLVLRLGAYMILLRQIKEGAQSKTMLYAPTVLDFTITLTLI